MGTTSGGAGRVVPAMNMRLTVIAIIVAFVGAGITWMLISSADPDGGAKGKVFVTKSGLEYVEETVGSGKVAERGRTVVFHFTAVVKDKLIGSSHEDNKPVRMVLGKKEKGIPPVFHEGIAGMKEGGVRRLAAPPQLANVPEHLVPPDEPILFKLELLKVE